MGCGLAKKLREVEYMMEELTGHRLKVVETAGTKIEDILHNSNPWKGKDCERKGCLLCETKGKNWKETDPGV